MKKKYLKKVKSLLPRRLRAEVLRDLEEIFDSAAEHGETAEEVADRLGCPCDFAREAALQLGTDLDKRKKKRRIASVLVSGILAVILGFLHMIIRLKREHAASIGIIGGADGPTAIFISGPGIDLSSLLLPAAIIAAFVCVLLLGGHLKKKK
ncbi:MAG: sodium ion-translocating decarboxylase subunit beta [Oscillospiraceae bacterium]|nr:sodium ion-translocating decarboxylase subunit beta [Oscillospiraceae bacterium]